MEVKIIIPYHDLEGDLANETVWTKKVGNYYEINNIPFFAPNISFEDIVDAE
jgi:hypothetical protein